MRGLFVAVLLVTTLVSPLAMAQPEEHPAFDAAMDLMRKGSFSQACPILEEVFAAQPSMRVQFRLAECYEQIGRLASAHNAFMEVAAEARRQTLPDREAFAKKKASEIAPRVPKLKLVVPPEVGAVEDLAITVDADRTVGRDEWSKEIPLDLGTHTISVTGTGYQPWNFDFELKAEGEMRTVQVPNQTSQPKTPPTPVPDPDTAGDGGMSTQAIAGIAVAAGGVVMMAIGIGVGVAAKGEFDDSLAGCTNGGPPCTPQANAMQESAVTTGTVGTVVFIIGAAALVGGGVLWLLAPSADDATETDVAFGITPGGFVVDARF